MLRSEFDNHPLWVTTSGIRAQVQQIRDAALPGELPELERVSFYVDYAETFRTLSDTHMVLFARPMLDGAHAAFAQVEASLSNRLAAGPGSGYTEQAASFAENSLVSMAGFPRPYGKGGQVTQMETLFENLLEQQRLSMNQLEAQHDVLRTEVDQLRQEAATANQLAITELASIRQLASEAFETVEAEKQRVDTVVSEGVKAIAKIETENSMAYQAWQARQSESFKSDFADLDSAMRAKLAESDEVYGSLLKTNQQYENLATLAAGDLIANNFSDESRWGRAGGIIAYIAGFALLAAAAIPLIWLLFEDAKDKSGAPDWGAIVIRLSIGVLAGSGATVLIRLGARLFTNADASKRMELELKSFGPFLANVESAGAVDTARIELLNRAFGKAYVAGGKNATDDAVPVGTFAQIIDLLTKLAK